MRTNRTWLIALVLFLSPAPVLGQQEMKSARDHPLVARYRGSRMVGYDEQPRGTYVLALGPISREYRHTEPLALEGYLRRFLYLAPLERTAPEVYRDYARRLAESGFEELFACAGEDCGYLFTRIAPHGTPLVPYAFNGLTRDHYYVAARAPTPTGGVYVAVNIVLHESPISWMAGRALARVDVVEVGPLPSFPPIERTP